MNKDEVLKKLDELILDREKIIIISGASLVVHDVISDTSDIDLSCFPTYFDKIDWNSRMCKYGILKYYDVFEISDRFYPKHWDDMYGFRFMTLKDCYELKKLLNRDKDKEVVNILERKLYEDDNDKRSY